MVGKILFHIYYNMNPFFAMFSSLLSNICPGDICPYQQYLTQFQPNFLDPTLWGSKKFWNTIFLDPNFWDPKLFGPKIILDLKFFLDPIVLVQNYFDKFFKSVIYKRY